ncbi:MAG: beta-propeller fold lactonase family protein [Solirubrobacterales bacterium]|nr:beta-propeller fold lactonase family protein [Solirubrobacterales bacterium]
MRRLVAAAVVVLVVAAVAIDACGGQSKPSATSDSGATDQNTATQPVKGILPQKPSWAPLDPHNVYAAAGAGDFAPAARHVRPLIYVPNSESNTVDEIDPHTYKIVREFPVGTLPQHVIPAYDLRTLYVANDEGNSLTPINPVTGIPGPPIAVDDPYNMYFTPDGRYAVVVEERMRILAFRDAHTMKLDRALSVPQCAGVNHADYTADGRYMLLSCEFGSSMIVVDVPGERVVKSLPLRPEASPQDVKLSPDGRVFYVADLVYGGLFVISARNFNVIGFVKTGAGAHGLYPSRDDRFLYVSDRSEGAVSVVSFATRRVVKTWPIPGGSPDMGNVSADGRVLWLSGRYDGQVYAIDTQTGRLLARIPVGAGPHGVCVWPQPGRYSLGHTGIMR